MSVIVVLETLIVVGTNTEDCFARTVKMDVVWLLQLRR